MWWFILAIGAWLFSGFISVSAIDAELRLLSIYGSARKHKIAEEDYSRLVEQSESPQISHERESEKLSSRL